MVQFLLGCLLVLIGVFLLVAARTSSDGPTPPDRTSTGLGSGGEHSAIVTATTGTSEKAGTALKRPRSAGSTATMLRLGAVASLGLGALLLFASTLYTQDVGEAVVIRTPGGTISGTDTSPGFSMKAPWNDIVRYDVRNQVITMAGDGSGTDGPALTAQTSDNASASVDITVRYSIVPAKVGDIYQQYRTQEGLVQRALDVDVRSIVRDVPVNYSASELRQKRVQVSSDIQKALQSRWTPMGVTVDSVDLRDIRYPEEIEKSLSAIQTARSKVESARAELESSKITAEKVKTEAQAQSDSDQIIRCGATSTTVTETVAGKEVQSVKVVPVPPAQCQNRLNEQVLTSKYIDMLREAAAKGNTVYVVPPNQSSLLQLPAHNGAQNSTPTGPVPSPVR